MPNAQIRGSSQIKPGTITDTEIVAAAGIAYSKLDLSASIVNADVAAGAAIALSKLANIATGVVLGRSTAGSGAIEELSTLPTAVQDNIARVGPAVASSGAMAFTPAAGSGFSVTLSTTGDFAVNVSQFFIDTSNGFVGIGTAAPEVGLDVQGAGDIGRFRLIRIDGVPDYVTARKTSGGGAVSSGDGLGSFIFRGWDGATFRNAAAIQAFVDGTPGASDMPGRLGFYTAQDGSATLREAMRVDNQQNVLIGTTATAQSLLDVNGSIGSRHATAGIGYTAGAGGTVTQNTNKSTGVTLNKVTGLITLNNAALAANTSVSFTLTDSAIAATDTIVLQHDSAGTAGAYNLNAQPAAGSATITVSNRTGGSLSEAIVIRFTVLKSVSA